MSEYPWNKKNNTFTWLSSPYNPFKMGNSLRVLSFQVLANFLQKLAIQSHIFVVIYFQFQLCDDIERWYIEQTKGKS